MLRINEFVGSSCPKYGFFTEIAIMWMSWNTGGDKLTLVQIMIWCRQAQTITYVNMDPDIFPRMASLG